MPAASAEFLKSNVTFVRTLRRKEQNKSGIGIGSNGAEKADRWEQPKCES